MAPVVPGRAEGRCGATDRLRPGGGGPGAGGGGAGACASRAGWWWGHRDRVREWGADADPGRGRPGDADGGRRCTDRKRVASGKSVSVRVDLDGSGIIKKKK